MKCAKCGKPTEKSYSGVCQGCYRYYRTGGTDNPLPDVGKVIYDHRGYVVCHICGRAYKRLGSHVKESHDMTIDKYKEQFGLCAKTKTTEANYSKHMHNLAYLYKMPQRLQVSGKSTRIKKGDKTMRKGKQVRLQEILNKKERMKRYYADRRNSK